MRKLLLIAPALLTACATIASEPVVHGETPGHTCVATDVGHFIGQPATSDIGAAVMRESHAAVLRLAPPGVMLTMDYRTDRVTVRTGPDNRITAINCG